MDFSIITVTWNSAAFITDQLASVFGSEGGATYEVFVVDNASSDDTVARVRAQFPQVHLIENTQNLGFAKANNIAIAQATGRYVLLLNPDMRVFPNTLRTCARLMDAYPEAGILGPHLVDEHGNTVSHVRRFPTLADQLAILLKLPHVFPHILDRYLAKDFDYTKQSYVDMVRGSFMCIRRELITQIGGIDERYFIWMEDVDYCKEAVAAGWKILYEPNVECIDFVGRSFALVNGYRKQRYFVRSLITYFKKWHPRWQQLLVQCVAPIALASAWIAEHAGVRSRAKT